MELLTNTKRRDFQNCRRYYLHRHLQRLTPRLQKGGRRRGSIFGNAVFDCVMAQQALIETDPDANFYELLPAVAWHSVSTAYEQIVDDANLPAEDVIKLEAETIKVMVMVVTYLETYGFDIRREIEFDLPLVNPRTGYSSRAFRRAGKIDGCVIIGPKTVSIIEDKFVGSIQKAMIQRLPLDAQATEYVDAFLARGWDAHVRYRHTKVPGKNPLPPKQFKTKDDYPGETLDEFRDRLYDDVRTNPDSYFNEQVLYFPKDHLEDYRAGRWGVAQEILRGQRVFRQEERKLVDQADTGADVMPLSLPLIQEFPMNPSRCWEYGGCEFIPLCTKQGGALDLYEVVEDNQELSTVETGKATDTYVDAETETVSAD